MRRNFFAPLPLLGFLLLLAIALPARALTAQTITFAAQGGQTYTPAGTFALSPVASADSGLTVSYSSTTPAVCTVAAPTVATVTIVTAGTCTIAADQAGDATYAAATQVTQSITIAKASQTITFSAQAGQTYAPAGTFSLSPVGSTTSSLAITYTALTPAACSISGSTVTIVAVGTCTIAANQAGDSNYNAASQVTQNIVISKASQTITFPAQAGQSFGGAAFPLSPVATTTSGLTILYASTTPAVCTISVSTVTIVAVGTCTIAANQAGDSNYNAAVQVTQNIVIGTAAQTITFGAQAARMFGAAPAVLSPLATASSALAITYTSTTLTICTITAGTGIVTIVAVGTCTIAANQAGNGSYSAALQVTQDIVINKASQTITFGAQTGKTFGAAAFNLSPLATATSALAVSYSSTTTAVCTISGSTVTLLGAGTCTIAADQAGDSSYNAAPQVTQNIAVGKATQTITFGGQGAQTMGIAPFALSPLATTTSGLALTYSSITTSICTVAGTTVTVLAAGTCTVAANQSGNTDYNAAAQVTQSITVGKGGQTITFGAQTSQVFGTLPFALSPAASASSGLTVTYTSTTPAICTISGSTVTIVGIGTCTIAANQSGSANFNAAPQVSQNIVIGGGSQTITFPAQASKLFGAAAFALSPVATASSSLTISYSSTTPTVCTISGVTVTLVSAGTCIIAANQAGNANYSAAAQVTQTITVGQATQTITFGTLSGKLFGVAPFALSPLATASSGLSVVYSSTTAAVCTLAGTTVTILAAGTCTIAADQAGNANYGAAPQVTQNIVVGKGAQTITFGAQSGQVASAGPTFVLSPLATASSGLAVTYTSTTLTVCTVLGSTVTIVTVGSCIIAANQAGSANYNAAVQVTQTITIGKPTVPGAPTINNVTAGFGSANISFTAPVLNGGSLITSYTGYCSASGQTTRTSTGAGTASLVVVTGLAVNVTYSCWVLATNAVGNSPISSALPVTPTPTYAIPTTATSTPLTGLWWNENESGWGLSVTQHGAKIFAAWFAYDQFGAAAWYVMSDCPILGNACTGDIYQVSGGSAFSAPWNGNTKVVTKVGTGILTFNNQNTGAFSYVISGASGLKSITRQVFAVGSTAPAIDYSDLWWSPSEAGWGVFLSHEYGMIFAVMFGYEASGNPVWYVASSCRFAANSCSGDLYQVTGGATPTVTWNSPTLSVTKVGVVDFVFSDDKNGKMNFFINGAAGSKTITRQMF